MLLTINLEQKSIYIKTSQLYTTKYLKINFNFSIQQVPSSLKVDFTNSQQFKAILGIKIIQNVPFLVVIKQHKNICAFQGSQIYEVKSIDWIPITQNVQLLENDDIKSQLNKISELFDQGFHYYSDNYDLWKTYLQNIKKNKLEEQKYQQQFIWNRNLILMDYKNIISNELDTDKYDKSKQYSSSSSNKQNKQQVTQFQSPKYKIYKQRSRILQKWSTKIIQGYVQSFQTVFSDDTKLQYFLISRRSISKAGTRFFSRGIDDNGNVANYAQSQQIFLYGDYAITNVQIRGSVPVFFQQLGIQGITIQLNIQRNQQLTKKAFLSHFNKIKQNYSHAVCVNLLSIKKKSQQKLIQFFQTMLKQTKKQILHTKYVYFDFHQQCKNNKFQNSSILIKKIQEIIQAFGFNVFNRKQQKLIKVQSGVFRTNCLDCLDRTNYVQSRIALETFKCVLKQYGSQAVKQALQKHDLLNPVSFQQNSQVLNNFNKLWAQNGDSISLHYTGIGSTHTDITKTGKRTLFGTINHKMRSLMRFYTQFTDINKHQTINELLGNKSYLGFSLNPSQLKQIKKQQFLFLSWQFSNIEQSIKQFQTNPYENKIFQKLLQSLNLNPYQSTSQTHNQYTLIVLYLYVPNKLLNWSSFSLDFKNVISSMTKKKSPHNQILTMWSDYLTSQLESMKFNYALIDKNQLEDSKMLIFCKRNNVEKINSIRKDQIVSALGTKESVLITKFKFEKSSIIFQGFNVKDFKSFLDHCEKSHKKAFRQISLGKAKSTSIGQQSYKIILGNIGVESKLSQTQFQSIQHQFNKKYFQYKLIKINQHSSRPPKEANQQLSQKIVKLLNKAIQNDQLKIYLDKNLSLPVKQKAKVSNQSQLINYTQAPLQFIPSNNRILFWNEENKIISTKFYKQHILFKQNRSEHNICNQNNSNYYQKCVWLDINYQFQQKINE